MGLTVRDLSSRDAFQANLWCSHDTQKCYLFAVRKLHRMKFLILMGEWDVKVKEN